MRFQSTSHTDFFLTQRAHQLEDCLRLKFGIAVAKHEHGCVERWHGGANRRLLSLTCLVGMDIHVEGRDQFPPSSNLLFGIVGTAVEYEMNGNLSRVVDCC